MDAAERQRRFAEIRARIESQAEAAAKRELDSAPVREVSMTELHSDPAGVIARVREGEIVIVSKHRRAVAMVLPLVDDSRLSARDPSTAVGLPSLANEFERRARSRRRSARMHGRWYRKRYDRYRR